MNPTYKSKLLVVVSKFKEDTRWISECQSKGVPFLIYDKSDKPLEHAITLQNIGREAETLLRFIIDHYDSLPEYTIFLQGDPGGTPPMYTLDQAAHELCNKVSTGTFSFDAILTCRNSATLEHIWARKSKTLFLALFGSPMRPFWFAGGAQYVLPRDNILCRPKRLYELLHAQVIKFDNKGFDANDPSMEKGLDPWTMEIMWGAIFNPEFHLPEDYENNLTIHELKS